MCQTVDPRPNGLQRLSADGTARSRVYHSIFMDFSIQIDAILSVHFEGSQVRTLIILRIPVCTMHCFV